ncbi:hypothetical protein JCM10908_005201 [Rhodotorula pacifica]|uniref:uncharacterized protein n=1 Tax=Rhodotorula pacifica TaxID=1495444 RepID=UPI0031720BFF
MSLGQRTASLFLIDCSASMGRERVFEIGEGDNKELRTRTGLDVSKEYVKSKIVARIIRDLKTTPLGVILFGYPKTKNLLTARAKENAAERDEKFDRSNDPYQGCYELLPLQATMDRTLLDKVDLTVAGEAADGDAFTAAILGIETLEGQTGFAKYQNKELYILTDGESEINWDGLEDAAAQMNAKRISLSVIGMDFDDEDIGFVEENKSEIKRTNEEHFRQLVDLLEQPSIVANARQAINAMLTPQVRLTNSRADRMTLKLGDPVAHPDSSITIYIDVKKATTPAAPPSMKQMSMRGFERVQAQAQSQSQSQSQAFRGVKRKTEDNDDDRDGNEDEDDEEAKAALKAKIRFEERQNRETRAQMNAGQGVDLGKLGVTFDKALRDEGLAIGDPEDDLLASHLVVREPQYYYRPSDKATNDKGKQKARYGDGDEYGDEYDEDVEAGAREQLRSAANVELTDAFYYGGTLVPVGDLEDDVGTLTGNETGMEIVSFMKESDLRYDYRMGDVFYVYGAPGFTASEKTFSAFVNAMYERSSVALVRFVKKGGTRNGRFRLPDPMLGIMYPAITEEGVEFCHWARMPFAEDIRALDFPSLERLFNQKNRRIMEHALLPTQPMLDAMDTLVDSMDLTTAGPPNENGEPTDFFHVEDSYSPAIHNIQNTLIFRLCNPEGNLPPVPPILTKYMDPPPQVAAKAEEAAQKVKDVCNIKIVPPKLKKITKRTQHFTAPGEDDTISYATVFGADRAGKYDSSAGTTAPRVEDASLKPKPTATQPVASSSSRPAHEPSNGTDDDLMVLESTTPEKKPAAPAPAAGSDSEAEPDTEEEPDTEDDEPVAQARELRSADEITKELAEAQRLVITSFSWGSYDLAKEAILRSRQAAEKLGASATYNAGLRTMVDGVREQPKKHDFLRRMRDAKLGLLVDSEMSADQAAEFLDTLA